MAILAECPICKNKQAVKNKKCKCGADLDKFKKSGKVRYWIQYRLPDGRQKKEFVRDPRNEKDKGSYDDAVAAHGKRISQKKEDRIMDMIKGSNTSIEELCKWYLKQRSVKKLRSYKDVKRVINNFKDEYGSLMAINLKQTVIEDYQEKRQDLGMAAATIDKEIRMIKTMVNKWFINDKVDGRVLKAFHSIEKKMGDADENVRKRTITHEEYTKCLKNAASASFKDIMTVAYYTGMRAGEIANLRYEYYDKKAAILRLPKEITKEKKAKRVPVVGKVKKIISNAIRCTHHDHIFYSSLKNPYDKWAFGKLLSKTCEFAKIPFGQKTENGLTFHDFRRTVKTNMVAAGVDKVYRDLILGHTLKGMDKRYIQVDGSKLVEQMEKYTAWLDDQLADVTLTVTPEQKSS